MRQDLPWLGQVCEKNRQLRGVDVTTEDLVEQLDLIDRGFDDIEHRIMNMDREHTKYIRATVTRLNYLLNQEDTMKGLVIDLLNHLSEAEGDGREADVDKVGKLMNLSQLTVISERSLYKRRKPKQDFTESLKEEEEHPELSREEILRMNKIKNRYSRKQVEGFVMEKMKEGAWQVDEETVGSEEEFEKLVLAYDYSTRKGSPYRVREQETQMVDNGRYRYPGVVFEEREAGRSASE